MNLIEKSIERIVDDKISNVVSRINASNKTYAGTRSVVNRDEIAGSTAGKKPTEDSRRITKDTRNEMITWEKEREVRANNFIIHGIEEKGEDLQDIKKSDSQIIKLFFEKVEVGAQPTHYIRLGKPNAKKKRPLKVLMENKHEKDKVMSNLRQLKGTEMEFGEISVTEDHTIEERQEIKTWVEKAKAKNQEGDNPETITRLTSTRLAKTRIAPGEIHQAIATKHQTITRITKREKIHNSRVST